MGLRQANNHKAFSLLELLVAIAILSIGIVVVLQALSFSARVTGLSCDIVNATLLAEDELEELEFKEKQHLLGTEPSTVTGEIEKFKWQYTLELLADLSIYKMGLSVVWQRANRNESFNINSYFRQ